MPTTRPPSLPRRLALLALFAAAPAFAEGPAALAPASDARDAPVEATPAGAEAGAPLAATPPAATPGASATGPTATPAPSSPAGSPAASAAAAAARAARGQSAVVRALPAITAPNAAPGAVPEATDAGSDPDLPAGADAEAGADTQAEPQPDAAEEAAAAPAPRARRARPSSTERWVRRHVPDNLEGAGAFGVEWWQWIALPLLGLVSAAAGRLAGSASRASLHRLVRVTPAHWDDALLERGRGPLYLAWGVGVAWLLSTFLYLRPPAAELVTGGLRIGLLVALLWLALRAVDIAGEAATQTAQRKGNPGAASVVPLVVRSSKIGLVALGAVSVLSALGYPVASLLAGLGIGGLALALAAQKTAENVFGSVSIGVDQPFRVGDLVKIEDFLGVVERIGLRSTSIRTADRTLVTLPNGRLADMRVENFAVRDRLRLFCTIALEHGARAEQVRAVLAGIEARLRAHPNLWPDTVTVRLARIGPHSLDIDVAAWFLLPDPDVFLLVRQELLLQFLEVVEEAGARIALPAQSVHVVAPKT